MILVGYLVLIASGLLFYFPTFMLNVKQNNPHTNLKQIKRKYNFGAGFTFVLIIYVTGYIILHEKTFGEKYFLLLVPLVSGISLFDAIFAIRTGTYPLHPIERVLLFQNDDITRMKKIAVWQIYIAVALSVIALTLYFI